MSAYNIIIVLSILVILSYVFDLLAKWIKLPSVLMLLGAGVLIRIGWDFLGFQHYNVRTILEILGIIGLIMIVLDGALDLELSKEKIPLIRSSFLAAAGMLIVSSLLIAWCLYEWYGVSFRIAWLNAIPLSVISSAVAIPSAANLRQSSREFIIYESSFSDILGIMIFNFAVLDDAGSTSSLFLFSGNLVLIVLISMLCSVALIFFIHYTKVHMKFFIVFAFLFLVYSLAKKIHLSSLLLIMFFGLVINNYKLFKVKTLQKWLKEDKFDKELDQLKMITAESAFIIRTFFFLLFGYSLNLNELNQGGQLFYVGMILAILLFVRFLYLKFISKSNLLPELFIAPKGLITVLLFYSIPVEKNILGFGEGAIFLLILGTCLLMMAGTLFAKKENKQAILERSISTNE